MSSAPVLKNLIARTMISTGNNIGLLNNNSNSTINNSSFEAKNGTNNYQFINAGSSSNIFEGATFSEKIISKSAEFLTNIFFDGTTNDENKTKISVADPTQNNEIIFLDASGTVALENKLAVKNWESEKNFISGDLTKNNGKIFHTAAECVDAATFGDTCD